MAGVLQYQALDDRGEVILDELEARLEVHSDRWADDRREFYVAAVGEVDLDPNLAAIDPDWEQHIARLTERSGQKTEKGLEIPVPSKGDFDAAMRKVAPPVGRKRPDGKGQPPQQSE
jgi:hypothetical protein